MYNFQRRVCSGIILIGIFGLTLYFSPNIAFPIVGVFFLLMSLIELVHFSKKEFFLYPWQMFSITAMTLVIMTACISFVFLKTKEIVLIAIGVILSDTMGYLIGRSIGKKIIKEKPFPIASPGKTWEGTIAAMLSGAIYYPILTSKFNEQNIFFAFIGIFAVIGDLLESITKRHYYLEDSNENVSSKFLKGIEKIVDGHGGFLDRADSISFTLAIYFIIKHLQ